MIKGKIKELEDRKQDIIDRINRGEILILCDTIAKLVDDELKTIDEEIERLKKAPNN